MIDLTQSDKGKRTQAWILWVIGSLQFLVTVYANSSAIITVYLFRSCMAEQKSPTLIIKLFASPVSCVPFPPPWLAECFKLNSATNLIYILFYLIYKCLQSSCSVSTTKLDDYIWYHWTQVFSLNTFTCMIVSSALVSGWHCCQDFTIKELFSPDVSQVYTAIVAVPQERRPTWKKRSKKRVDFCNNVLAAIFFWPCRN